MLRQSYLSVLFLLVLCFSSLQARRTELILQNASDGHYVPAIPVYVINQSNFVALQDLMAAYKTQPFNINPGVIKTSFRIQNLKIKVTAYNRYVVIEDKTFQMPRAVVLFDGETYLPMEDFVLILKKVGLVSTETLLTGTDTADLIQQKTEQRPEFSPYDIVSAKIEERQNGTLVRIRLANGYDPKSVKHWINRDEWLYMTIPSALVNKSVLEKTPIPHNSTIRSISADQLEGTTQLTFHLRTPVDGSDLLNFDNPPEIGLLIRRPFVIDQSHYLDQERSKWKLDKVVLDAGHGGHDSGARGNNTREKDITLDVVKRLGKLIEDRTDIEVVYTRETDVFIPLRKRTKIANEAQGKVFLSVHVNASKNRSASGFETYLLRPGKTDEAIAVAELENSVIQLEQETDEYTELSAEQLILATMAQSSFIQQSETLADLVQSEFDKKLVGQNRGVKQAGFRVLIGASMPNVLIELGFISNRNDAKRLKQAAYRQKAAEAIFQALMKYKTRHEKILAP